MEKKLKEEAMKKTRRVTIESRIVMMSAWFIKLQQQQKLLLTPNYADRVGFGLN